MWHAGSDDHRRKLHGSSQPLNQRTGWVGSEFQLMSEQSDSPEADGTRDAAVDLPLEGLEDVYTALEELSHLVEHALPGNQDVPLSRLTAPQLLAVHAHAGARSRPTAPGPTQPTEGDGPLPRDMQDEQDHHQADRQHQADVQAKEHPGSASTYATADAQVDADADAEACSQISASQISEDEANSARASLLDPPASPQTAAKLPDAALRETQSHMDQLHFQVWHARFKQRHVMLRCYRP